MQEKIIIYTSITGGYDPLQQPFPVPEGMDIEFLCFVRKGTKTTEYDGLWRIEEIPFDWDDQMLLSRYPKMNPQSALPEDCNWSLWIDGNVQITGPEIYRRCIELQEAGVRYAGVSHPDTDCVYEEAIRCMERRKEKFIPLMRLVHFLRKNGLPEHSGVMENNLIFRKHNDPDVVEFDRWWWECFLKYPKRDQMTHSFCMLDTPSLQCGYIFPEGVSTKNSPGLKRTEHPRPPKTWYERKILYQQNAPLRLLLRIYIKLTGLFYSKRDIRLPRPAAAGSPEARTDCVKKEL